MSKTAKTETPPTVRVKLSIRQKGRVSIDADADIPEANALALYEFFCGGCDPKRLVTP